MNCWAHGLRDLKPFAQEPVIGPIVEAIGKLYDVERKAKKQVEKMGLEGQEAIAVYTRLRDECSRPQLAIIHKLLLPASDQYPKRTAQRNGIEDHARDVCTRGWTLTFDECLLAFIRRHRTLAPILTGASDIWGNSDVYRTYKAGTSLPAGCTAFKNRSHR